MRRRGYERTVIRRLLVRIFLAAPQYAMLRDGFLELNELSDVCVELGRSELLRIVQGIIDSDRVDIDALPRALRSLVTASHMSRVVTGLSYESSPPEVMQPIQSIFLRSQCPHGAEKCSDRTSIRKVWLLFNDAPHLWRLRNRLILSIMREKTGYGTVAYIVRTLKPLLDHRQFTSRQLFGCKQRPAARFLERECRAAGVLSDREEGEIVTVFVNRGEDILRRHFSDSSLIDDGVLRRYFRLCLLPSVRKASDKRSDRVTDILREKTERLRLACRFHAYLASRRRHLHDFERTDVDDFGTGLILSKLRAFLLYLHRSGVRKQRCFPAVRYDRRPATISAEEYTETITRLLTDGPLALELRVYALLRIIGMSGRHVISLRTSALKEGNELETVRGSFSLHPAIGDLVRALAERQSTLGVGRSPVDPDPWLIHKVGIDAPSLRTVTSALSRNGISIRKLSARSFALLSQDALPFFAYSRMVGRSQMHASRICEERGSKASKYAASLQQDGRSAL